MNKVIGILAILMGVLAIISIYYFEDIGKLFALYKASNVDINYVLKYFISLSPSLLVGLVDIIIGFKAFTKGGVFSKIAILSTLLTIVLKGYPFFLLFFH